MRGMSVSYTHLDVYKRQSQDLADADLPKMIRDVDSLAATSESSIQTAVDKLNSIDFDALNSAITDLSNIVRPLGRLFGN